MCLVKISIVLLKEGGFKCICVLKYVRVCAKSVKYVLLICVCHVEYAEGVLGCECVHQCACLIIMVVLMNGLSKKKVH